MQPERAAIRGLLLAARQDGRRPATLVPERSLQQADDSDFRLPAVAVSAPDCCFPCEGVAGAEGRVPLRVIASASGNFEASRSHRDDHRLTVADRRRGSGVRPLRALQRIGLGWAGPRHGHLLR